MLPTHIPLPPTPSRGIPDNVEIVVKVPPFTPTDGVVYLSGNRRELGQWRPDGFRLRRQRDGTWLGRLRLDPGDSAEFKVTLGRWDRVEKDAQGFDVPNRRVIEDTPGQHIYQTSVDSGDSSRYFIEVQNWGQPFTVPHTIVGELHGHERFYSQVLSNTRTIWVWLPPGYGDHLDQRYPVVYMHDGQNLFDSARAAFGVEWQVDEAATKLIESGQTRPFIVVGVENTADRFGEYTPTPAGGIGGRGSLYGRFLVTEVMPFINTYYRTLITPEHTFTAGSSLGGLISLYLLREYPHIFGGCAGISPSLWWDAEDLLRSAETDARWAVRKRVWIDMGTAEAGWGDEGGHVTRTLRMREALLAAGIRKSDLACQIVPDAHHDEAAWAERIDQILAHLIGK